MHRHGHDIRSGKGVVRQVREEPCRHQPITFETTPLLFRAVRVCRSHQAARLPICTHRESSAVRKGADQGAFWQGELVIGRHVHARLDEWQLQEGRQRAAHDEWQSEQVGQNGSRSVETIQPQQCGRLVQLVRSQGGVDRLHRSAQLRAVLSVARIANGAEPLRGVGVQHRRPGPHHVPSCAACGARSTRLIQTTVCGRVVLTGWQGALSGRLSRPIDVEDLPELPSSVGQPTRVLLDVCSSREQIVEKERSQCFE